MSRDSERKTPLPEPPPELVGANGDDLLVSRAIVRLAELGSFSAAARALGVSVSAITRAVQRHEQRLGSALFLRSTHGLSVTEAGKRYAEHLRRWLHEEDELRASLRAERGAQSGSLRVTVPVFVAERLLVHALRAFHAAYPQVTVEVHASDDIRDVIKEGLDLAIRLGPLQPSNLRTRAVAGFRRLIVAAPALLAERAAPAHPSELRDFPCLLYLSVMQEEKWDFWSRDGELISVPLTSKLRTNNLELLRELALAGEGIARLPDGAVLASIASGELVQLFPEYTCTPCDTRPTIYAVHASNPGKDRLREAFLQVLEETAAAKFQTLERRRPRA